MKDHLLMHAPAKVNLHLEILDRRDDGFHDLLSIFQKVDLFDEIEITIEEANTFSCTIEDGQSIPLGEHTIYRAAKLFSERTGIRFSAEVTCRKGIPAMAGLGGGSSDAAAVLSGLQQMTGFPLSETELVDAGAQVGSDVPFFLGGSAALVSGRGEYTTPIQARSDLSGLLVVPPFGVSTPEAFRRLDARREQAADPYRPISRTELLRSYDSPVTRWPFFNSFSPILMDLHEEYRAFMDILGTAGYRFMTISGSGSSLLAVTEDSSAGIDSLPYGSFPDNVWIRSIKMLADDKKAVYNRT